MEVRVDSLALAEGADLRDGLLGCLHEAEGVLLADALDQRRDLRPPREREASISPGRPSAADVLVENDDVGARLELLDAERRPEPGVATADEADVGLRVLEELLGLGHVLRTQGLLEPE
jgi:hypothetical protein